MSEPPTPETPAPESPFASADRLLVGMQNALTAGGEYQLGPKGLTVAHVGIYDTSLAACLATLGVPLRETAPFTDDVGLDTGGNETARRKAWWLGASDPFDTHKTDDIVAAWQNRVKFEAENPLHPLNAMRAAIDARSYWIDVLHAYKSNRAILPIETKLRDVYATDSLHGASVLKACGYRPLAFNRRGFFLEERRTRLPALTILTQAAQAEGQTPPMWMSRVLRNLSDMLKHIKADSVILRQQFDSTTVLLSEKADPKTRDRFLSMT